MGGNPDSLWISAPSAKMIETTRCHGLALCHIWEHGLDKMLFSDLLGYCNILGVDHVPFLTRWHANTKFTVAQNLYLFVLCMGVGDGRWIGRKWYFRRRTKYEGGNYFPAVSIWHLVVATLSRRRRAMWFIFAMSSTGKARKSDKMLNVSIESMTHADDDQPYQSIADPLAEINCSSSTQLERNNEILMQQIEIISDRPFWDGAANHRFSSLGQVVHFTHVWEVSSCLFYFYIIHVMFWYICIYQYAR